MSGDLHSQGQTATAAPSATEPLADILVVDDDENNLVAIEAALGELGRRLVKCQSGKEALRQLLDQDYCLILLDVQMPGMDGFETAQLIRSRQRSRHVPIIFVTAYNRDDADILRGYELGAVDFLFKPIVPEVLRAKASVFVELQDRTEEVRKQGKKLAELERREHHRKLAEERQRWEAEVLREENRRKDEFLAMLAHELRNPLAPIVTGLELVKMAGVQEPLVKKAHASMERQVHHLTRLVDDLLDISRISQGKITLRQEPIDLQAVVRQAVDGMEPQARERQHTLEVEGPEGELTLVGDQVRLTQVVSNLLSNAIRYTDPGGRIRLEYGRDGSEAFLRVSDNGRGIAPEMIDRIFDLFVQERDGGRGLGLGLTLVQRLVELHGGRVLARSDGRGHGSTFEVRIPRPLTEIAQVRREKVEAAPSNGTGVPLRIAIVEDDPDIRETMSTMLGGWGHEVHVAEDGIAGVNLLKQTMPDVAIVDIGMPGLDGYGLAQRVREELGDRTPHLIAVTGFGSTKDKERARAAGFDAHIVKPARPEDLRAALRNKEVHGNGDDDRGEAAIGDEEEQAGDRPQRRKRRPRSQRRR